METIQTTALLKPAKILRRVLETYCHSNSSEKLSTNTGVKNSKRSNNNNNVPADHRVKLKEGEMKDKYPDLASELKKLWNMKVTIIPIVSGALGTVIKGLVKNWRIWK